MSQFAASVCKQEFSHSLMAIKYLENGEELIKRQSKLESC